MDKCLFLDRDGIVNHDVGYAGRPADFHFMPGIFALCRQAQQLGYRLVIVTNQSGIARGYYSEQDFAALCDWVAGRFAEHGITLDATYHCPHHPDISGPCDCRKPAPGMLLAAIRDLDIDPARSIMIGDKPSDMQAARAAGIGQRLLLSEKSTTDAPATAIIAGIDQAADYLS